MIKQLILVLAISLSTTTPPVQASEAPSFDEADLLEFHESKGGGVHIDSDFCTENEGFFGMQKGFDVHICFDAHKDDAGELLDTVRHEMWHVVQMCNGGPLHTDKAKSLRLAKATGWTGEGYSEDVWHLEAEAHLAASLLSAEDIRVALTNHCI